jgi:hypothetical protein
MRITSYIKTFAVVVIPALAASIALADDVRNYSIPKEHPPISAAAAGAAAGAEFAVNSAPIRWTLPAGWKELAPTAVRIGNFQVPGPAGKVAEVAITSFPGSVGTEIDNVNRWRREIGLTPVGQADISSEPVTIDSNTGKLYDLNGKNLRTIVASLPRNGAMWFFKLRGDAGVVADAKAAFTGFLKSIQFATVAATPPPSDPHAGLSQEVAASTVGLPKWKVPSNWTEKAPGPMVLKTFVIEGQQGQQAAIAISSFPGDVGGKYANVNRWRRQLGLPGVTQDELPSVTQSIDLGSANATLVDMSGTDPTTSKPTRLIAAIVPHGDATWFYKMLGSDALLDKEKPAFIHFIKTVKYP